jgi:hypothetical protein
MNTVKNILSKVANWYNVHKNINNYVYADYYNGSHNDAENVFIELKKLITDGHHHHGEFFHKRLSYLVNEGIDITSEQTAALKELVHEETKPVVKKTAKKAPKKASKVKKASKPKRDKFGRFIAHR